jgi:hypothetical protein
MFSRLTFILLFTCILSCLNAQICHDGKPVDKIFLTEEIYTIKFPGVPDEQIPELKKQSAGCHKTLKFAKVFQTSINPEETGYWTKTADGRKVWKVRLISPNAFSINITFGRFDLVKGAKVFVYDSKKDVVIGALTEKNNNPDKILAVSPVPGDEVIVELQVDKNKNNYGELSITSLGHDYVDIFNYLKKDGQFGRSGDCNVDINCIDNPSIQLLKRAICRIIYNNNELCTGTLINNTTHDASPYLLTANHCLPNQASASNAVFLFGYESPVCNGPDGNSSWTLSGSQLLATTKTIDFSLVKLSKEIPQHFFPYFAGWDHSNKTVSSTFTIHHPWGDVKKISFDNDPPFTDSYSNAYEPGSHWRVLDWDRGTTEPGSSGCPLFNSDYAIIGDLTGGNATCSNPVNDYFTKFSVSWDFFEEPGRQLKSWLDPIGTDFQSISGYFPYKDLFNTCHQMMNYSANDPSSLNQLESGWGYWSGHSSMGFKSFAEKFENDSIVEVRGIYITPGRIPDNDTGSITIKLWSGDYIPGSLLAKKKYQYNQLTNHTEIYLPFDTVITVIGSFFAGYDIGYHTPNETFAVYQVNSSIKSPGNSFYLMNNSGWQSYSQLTNNTEYTTLAVQPYICGNTLYEKPTPVEPVEPVFFPNPVINNLLTIDLKNTDVKNTKVFIYDLSGRLVHQEHAVIYERNIYVELDKLHNGMYVCEVIVNDNKYSTKLLISRN